MLLYIMQSEAQKRTEAPTGRPLQRISWEEKIKDNYDFFKRTANYYIHLSNFNFGTSPSARKDVRLFYQIYNNQFPLSWFNHITDPLSAKNPLHSRYPAKIRPTGMLRTNIDLLLGEYPKRPFVNQVVNMGEDAYNTYLDGLMKAVETNLGEHFLAVAQQAMQEAGHDVQQIPQEDAIETPESVKERYTGSYKDNLAIRGQRWLKRAMREYGVKPKMLQMFKDWLIAGKTYSYKNIENANFVYERVPSIEIDYDKSPNVIDIEDGEWAIRRQLWTISDVVDKFYTELTESNHTELEKRSHWVSPFSMYNYLQEEYSKYDTYSGKIPVYHVTWKGKKKIKYIEYADPFTGKMQEMVVDEAMPSDVDIKVTRVEWVNEVLETWRIGDDIYAGMKASEVQRNEMNNFSKCKLPYNGRNFSDTHAENISPLEMGIPYAIMYMITNFTLEKTIAKNKGKITLFDINAIPKREGWDDEKFFYYADALGYMLLDRNQIGVDKSWNQYSVLDMSLFDQIEKLILLRDSFKKDWDDLLGINAPRKGQTATNGDGLGVQQNLLFQSSVITDMIFMLFEQFTEKEMQGFIDFSKFVNVDGVRSIYNTDDFDRELLEIDPNSYCMAELGVFAVNSSEEQQNLNAAKQSTQAMLQNGVKLSTVLEVQRSLNYAELMEKVKQVEAIEMEQAQAAAANEQDHEKAMNTIKEKFARLASMLKIDEINAEYDRKDENVMLGKEYDMEMASMGGGDANNNGIPDAVEISKRVIAASKIASEERRADKEIASRMQIHKDTMANEAENRKLKEKEIAVKRAVGMKKSASSKK